MSKMNEKSRINLAVPTTKVSPKLIFSKNEVVAENTIFVSQLQELARYFSSIENNGIRQYGINLMRELAKCESEEKTKKYTDEMMS